MAWIQEQRDLFQARPMSVLPQIVTGETHSFFGRKYSLTVIEGSFRHFVHFDQETGITLNVRSGTTAEGRLRVLDNDPPSSRLATRDGYYRLGYVDFDLAEKIPGPTTERMARLAKQQGIYIIAPIYEEAEPNLYFNSAPLISPDG